VKQPKNRWEDRSHSVNVGDGVISEWLFASGSLKHVVTLLA